MAGCSRSWYHSLKSPNIPSLSGVAADIYRWVSQGISSFVQSKSGLGLLEQSHRILFQTRLVHYFIRRVINRWSMVPLAVFHPLITYILNFPVHISNFLPLSCLPRRTPPPPTRLFAHCSYSRIAGTVAVMRDAITQSASFEKERSMDPLSSSENKEKPRRVYSAKIIVDDWIAKWTSHFLSRSKWMR